MKNALKWIVFILIATVTIVAGMYCLAQYLDTKTQGSSDEEAMNEAGKPSTLFKPRGRHYTKLNLS